MTVLADLGGVAGSLGLAALMLARTRSLRLVGFACWALGAAALAYYLAPHGHRGVLVGAAAVGLIGAAVGAAILLRWPWLLAFAALAVAPVRIPVSVGDTQARLLLPLYAVVGAVALALAWELPGEERRSRELGLLAPPLGLWTAWTGISTLWTRDLRQAAIELLFFVLPFGLLAIAIARLPWSSRALTWLYGQLALMGVIFAAVGVYQWVTRDVFWNPKVIVGNAYEPIFRVNSVFYDPSIYGRFLVVAILAGAVVVLSRPGLRESLAVTAVIAATWVGLYYSYSQSSFASLIAGLLIAAALVWRRRAALVAAATVVVLAAGVLATPHVRHVVTSHTKSNWNRATSGRASLVSGGAHIFLDHPVAGVGVSGFKRAYADRLGLKGKEPKAAASHNTPVTVAAETGVVGLALLAWLIAAALVLAFRPPLRRRRRGEGSTGPEDVRAWPLGGFDARVAAACGIMVAAIFVHSNFYADLFEDPVFWGLLALTALSRRSWEARL